MTDKKEEPKKTEAKTAPRKRRTAIPKEAHKTDAKTQDAGSGTMHTAPAHHATETKTSAPAHHAAEAKPAHVHHEAKPAEVKTETHPVAHAAEAKPADPKKAKKARKAKKKGIKAVVARGKRKESVARATVRAGKGNVRFNKLLVSAISNPYIRQIVCQPLTFLGPEANEIDISVTVCGGGTMGQAQAARTAIANALVEYFDTINLREKFLQVDRTLLVEDVRRVEPKKYKGPKARARFQKSYR